MVRIGDNVAVGRVFGGGLPLNQKLRAHNLVQWNAGGGVGGNHCSVNSKSALLYHFLCRFAQNRFPCVALLIGTDNALAPISLKELDLCSNRSERIDCRTPANKLGDQT